MKPKSNYNRGKAHQKVPFVNFSIVACMDLVLKVVSKIRIPPVVKGKNELAVQLCFDLACSIRDRIEENRTKMTPELSALERAEWERNSPSVSKAYAEHDEAAQRACIDDANLDAARLYAKRCVLDNELREDPEFIALWKAVADGEDFRTLRNLSHSVETHAMKRCAISTPVLNKVASRLCEAKQASPPTQRNKVAEIVRLFVVEHYDSLLGLPDERMMELSDVAPRLALVENRWSSDFWMSVNQLATNDREFPPETFALRESSTAQFIIDNEIERAKRKGTKANRGHAFYEWALDYGARYGISPATFDYRPAFKACERQDNRLDKWLISMGYSGLIAYLAEDKTEPFIALESHVNSKFLRGDNEFSVMADKIKNSNQQVIHLGDTIGSVFKSRAHAMRKVMRYLPIMESR